MNKPIAKFRNPYFKKLSDEPEWIYFYSMKEAKDFLIKLPKDWLVKIILDIKQ